MKELNLRLPWPPSVNRIWASSRKGNWYSTKVATDFKNRVHAIIHDLKHPNFDPDERLAVTVYAYPPDKRKRDLDNIFKVIADALQEAQVYHNDVQIKRIYMEMMHRDQLKAGYVDVTITVHEHL